MKAENNQHSEKYYMRLLHRHYKVLASIQKQMPEKTGEIILQTLKYDMDGTEPVNPFNEDSEPIYHAIVEEIFETEKFYKSKYEDTCKQAQENGKKNKPDTKGLPSGTKGLPSGTYSVTDSVTENVTDSVIGSGRGSVTKSVTSGTPSCTPSASLSPQQKKAIQAAWNDHIDFVYPIKLTDLDGILQANTLYCINKLHNSNFDSFIKLIETIEDKYYFISRPVTGYKVQYSWFIDPDNHIRIIEGNYDNFEME